MMHQMLKILVFRSENIKMPYAEFCNNCDFLLQERAGGHKHNMARFSPNLPMSNQQLAANAKRRLSYDINRNIMS